MEVSDATRERVRRMTFASLYPLYVAKVARKGRTEAELVEVIGWLTGLSNAQLAAVVASDETLGSLLDKLAFHDNAHLITGTICGVKVELIEDPFMKRVRQLDKVVDELAKGRSVEKILRS